MKCSMNTSLIDLSENAELQCDNWMGEKVHACVVALLADNRQTRALAWPCAECKWAARSLCVYVRVCGAAVSHKSLAQPAAIKCSPHSATPHRHGTRGTGNPIKKGSANRRDEARGDTGWFPISHLDTLSPSPAVAAGKSGEGCIGDGGNPISPKDKEEARQLQH